MNPSSRRVVGFDGRQVVVVSDLPNILAAMERDFRPMIEATASQPVAQLEVTHGPEGFCLRDDTTWVKTQSADDILLYLNYQIVLRLIRARSDLIWLHAGAATCDDRAVLVSAVSGRGKSTIVSSLCCDLGWQFLTDDVAPLDPRSGAVFPFPQTPYFRPHPGTEIPRERLAELKKVEARIPAERICRTPRPVAALILPSYDPTCAVSLVPVSPAIAALELMQNCLNFTDHREAAFHRLCELVKPLPTFRLSFSSGLAAAQLVANAYAGGFK